MHFHRGHEIGVVRLFVVHAIPYSVISHGSFPFYKDAGCIVLRRFAVDDFAVDNFGPGLCQRQVQGAARFDRLRPHRANFGLCRSISDVWNDLQPNFNLAVFKLFGHRCQADCHPNSSWPPDFLNSFLHCIYR